MKRIIAVLLFTLLSVSMLCGCRREADMLETTLSSMMSTEEESEYKDNDGTVTDGDGHIGNEDEEHRTDTTEDTTHSTTVSSSQSDNVL